MSVKAETENISSDFVEEAAGHGTDHEIKIRDGEEAFDWNQLFGNFRPVEIEIGCGRGMFIIKSALENPEINFLGIEKSARFFRMFKERVAKSGAENIRLIRAEAGYLIKKFVPAHSVKAVHVYFPDPWPKRKHEKRRIWGEAFVKEILRVLEPGGHIYVASDVRAYFLTIQATLSRMAALEQVRIPRSWPITGYARKYLAVGRPLFCTMFVKHEPLDGLKSAAQRE